MPSVKTAVSLNRFLFDQVNQVAQELHVSRSRLCAIALEDFIKNYQNQKLLESINKAYDDIPDIEEERVAESMREKRRRMAKEEW
ncbi:MAG: hypothetical protein GY754_28260 [bacterium]|nr:hypothetical protein [bacterium]